MCHVHDELLSPYLVLRPLRQKNQPLYIFSSFHLERASWMNKRQPNMSPNCLTSFFVIKTDVIGVWQICCYKICFRNKQSLNWFSIKTKLFLAVHFNKTKLIESSPNWFWLLMRTRTGTMVWTGISVKFMAVERKTFSEWKVRWKFYLRLKVQIAEDYWRVDLYRLASKRKYVPEFVFCLIVMKINPTLTFHLPPPADVTCRFPSHRPERRFIIVEDS